MSIVFHERPGVYSDYTTSSVSVSAPNGKTVALIGLSEAKTGLYTVTSLASAHEVFGASSHLGRMCTAACACGAGRILAYSLAQDSQEDWQAAITATLAEKEASFCALGTSDAAVQQFLKDAILAASAQKGECIGIVAAGESDVESLVQRAQNLDCERMILVAPDAYFTGESEPAGVCVAAAVGGLLSCQDDPALPLNGASLGCFDGVLCRYEEQEIDSLVQGGVTVLEAVGGQVQILRGITTKKTVGEGCDTRFREVNTILVIDHVIPGIRKALSARFPRSKNHAVTRSAIRNLVVVELEDRLRREIIDSYENVRVEASEEDATVCLVSFSFAVTHGLSRIRLTAHISV